MPVVPLRARLLSSFLHFFFSFDSTNLLPLLSLMKDALNEQDKFNNAEEKLPLRSNFCIRTKKINSYEALISSRIIRDLYKNSFAPTIATVL